MPTSTITVKGQVTIPKAIRERLNLAEGDTLEFRIDDAGQIVARPRRPEKVCGILRDFAPSVPVTVEDMNKAVRRRAAANVQGRNR